MAMLVPAFGQATEEDRRRARVEAVEELRHTEHTPGGAIQFGPMPTKTGGWLFDYGTTLSTSYTTSNDNDRQDTVADAEDHSWMYDMRLFALFQNVPRTSKFYFRAAMNYTDAKKSSPAIRGHDFVQPKIDMLYWEHARTAGVTQRLRVGRQFATVGRGIAFGLTADGINWEIERGRWSSRFFALRQNPGDDNIDLLAPGSGRTKRLFYAVEGRYRLARDQFVGIYALMNDDRNFDFAVAGQKHQFDSKYFGLTLEVSPMSRLAVWGEMIVESGKTFPHAGLVGSTSKVNIHATAYDLGMRLYFTGALAPTIYAELAGASGDRDRVGNVYSSNGGSTAGKDTVFRSFGGMSLGVALAPTLANIHVFKAGGTLKPFARSSHRILHDMTLQGSFYHYLAEDELGSTSDPVYNVAPGGLGDNIGQEFDGQISWKVLSDLRALLQTGIFVPGPAYGVNRTREEYLRFKVSVDL